MEFFHEGEGPAVVTALSNEPLPADRATVELPEPALQRLVGRYEFNGMPMLITVADGTLHAQPATPERVDGVRVDLRLGGIRLVLGHLTPGPHGTWTITRLSTAADVADHRAVLITPQAAS